MQEPVRDPPVDLARRQARAEQLLTGDGAVLVPGQAGDPAIGML